jgi:3-phenylpropionate/cinnamic acid dioxygenase small subunit
MSELQDRQDISDLLIRYATGIDRRDWDLFRTVFTPDCQLDYGQIGSWDGVEAVTAFMDVAHAGAGHLLHRITNQVIDLDGDRATARSYVDVWVMAADNASGVNASGFYDDEIVRTGDGWRIARRKFTSVRIAMPGQV